MKPSLKIAIAEPSAMVRAGLGTLLRKLPGMQVSVVEIADAEALPESLGLHKPDILIASPQLLLRHSPHRLREEPARPGLKVMALLTSLCPPSLQELFDEQIGLYDTPDQIREKLARLADASGGKDTAAETGDEQQSLSAREKEIVICVVKGMTNREIAGKLFLSPHTVITHRRNIARKLQIHSPSALTIYAIVNKLVELKDIK